MSDPWSSPDPRRRPGVPVFGQPWPTAPAGSETPPAPPGPPVREDVRAGLWTFAITVLVGAPVGLLWAALAPDVVVVVAGGQVNLLDTYGDGFIAVDGYFLAAVVLAGLIGGVVAHLLASRHGPGVVVGLAVGGLAAAYAAMVTGEQVGLDALRAAVGAASSGRFELAVDLRSTQALVGWPVASLVAYLAATAVSTARTRPADVSSG